MSLTYCMTSTCPLSGACQRYEDDASAHCLNRTYADFSEELVRRGDGQTTCPFFLPRETPAATNATSATSPSTPRAARGADQAHFPSRGRN